MHAAAYNWLIDVCFFFILCTVQKLVKIGVFRSKYQQANYSPFHAVILFFLEKNFVVTVFLFFWSLSTALKQ